MDALQDDVNAVIDLGVCVCMICMHDYTVRCAWLDMNGCKSVVISAYDKSIINSD